MNGINFIEIIKVIAPIITIIAGCLKIYSFFKKKKKIKTDYQRKLQKALSILIQEATYKHTITFSDFGKKIIGKDYNYYNDRVEINKIIDDICDLCDKSRKIEYITRIIHDKEGKYTFQNFKGEWGEIVREKGYLTNDDECVKKYHEKIYNNVKKYKKILRKLKNG